jgi:hypothetical protein
METSKNLIQLPNEALIDAEVLEKLTTVTEADVDLAIQNWKVAFKDDEFENILEADG